VNFDVPELDPIGQLWFAVLLQSIEDALSFTLDESTVAAAKRWFRADREDVGSFKWVCNAINLDSETVLQRVRQQFRQRQRPALREGQIHGGHG
jgi:hypothetical protein